MSQWGQPQQPGFQYPMQTGFPGNNPQFQQNPQFPQQGQQFQQQAPQFQQPGGPGLVPQPTGFHGQRTQGFQQPQQTGFQGGPGFVQSQPTGFPMQTGNFQQRVLQHIPPVPPLPTHLQPQNQPSGFLGIPQQQQPQVNRFSSTSPAIGGGVLQSQPTGFPGRPGGGLIMPQATGFVDPRLQMMSSTFMPMNNTSLGPGAAPQVAPPQFNLQQSFQQHNLAQRGAGTHQMGWSLSKAEQKQYNDIFRSWDAQNSGFISGQTALDVFGASGLPKEDLAKIWTLADIDDRGKLNLAEFHIAMGLIYRRLSGMQIPNQLPPELVPPSARDLDASVEIMRDILRHESRNRSPSSLDVPLSRAKIRSLNDSSSTLDSSRDATIYKHNDAEPVGDFYKPRSRYINRDDVRSRSEDDSPIADLNEMKRRLANTAQMLDHAAEADTSRTAEDEALEREMEDLKYRVKRVSDDLEFVSRGPRTASKDQDRRKLERELLNLMHERIPEVERKIKARDERREREKRQWTRDRDRANDRFGRYNVEEDGRYDRGDRDRDRPYSRGGYRDKDEDRYDRDNDRSYRREARSRSRDRDNHRPRSPPSTRSPPQPAAVSSTRDTPAAPSPPRPSPSPAPLKKMTPEERLAFIHAEAQRRIDERKAALGVTAPAASPVIDTVVEDRLQQEKKEAEEKTKLAEKQAEERERLRKERLESERASAAPPSPSLALNSGIIRTPTRTVPSPAPPAPSATATAAPPSATLARNIPAPTPPAPTLARKPAPPPPKPRVPPPGARTAPLTSSLPGISAPAPVLDEEEEKLRAREEAIKKQREARAERLRQLEKEEEDAALRAKEDAARKQREEKLRQLEKEEEEEEKRYQARISALKAKSTPPVLSVTPSNIPATPPKPPTPPPVVTTPAADITKSTNPFSRFINKSPVVAATPSPVSAPVTNGSTNPWASSQPATVTSSTSSSGIKSYNTAPSTSADDEWDNIVEFEDDSSDDEVIERTKRADLAKHLFGSILPSSRPNSAADNGKPVSSPSSPAPAPVSGPPAPPAPPAAPPAPPAAPAPAAPTPQPAAALGDVSDLMRSIQGGAKLRPAKTVDKSGPALTGRVLDDSAPPVHISATPQPESTSLSYDPFPTTLARPEPVAMDQNSSNSNHRQSVGWFAERAADAGVPSDVLHLPPTREEEEEEISPAPIPSIQVDEIPTGTEATSVLMADIDKSIVHRVRSVYPYQGDSPDDLSFEENVVMTANPSKSGGDWWYGTLINTGKSGVFPRSYVEVYEPVKAKALYTYIGNNPDELPFTEGDELSIVDRTDQEWWRAEKESTVFIVPASYLEIIEGDGHHETSALTPTLAVRTDFQVEEMSGTEDVTRSSIIDIASVDGGQNDDEDDISDTSSDYLSFDDSDNENEPETTAARANERRLVIEAAGLILKQDDSEPKPVRARSMKRRPAPAVPTRSVKLQKELPSVPEPEPEPNDHTARLDDAFDRYESFKNTQNHNRISIASSIDTIATSPTYSTNSTQKEGESRGYSHFLQFLSRTKTPDGERKTTNLSISAPILSPAVSEDPSRSTTPTAFGMSWASLVDATALEGIPVDERRRQEAIFELIHTETTYVRDLQLIVEIFYSTLLPLLSRKEVTVIFANIEDILLTNTSFLSSLEERQKECRLYVDRIGDMLLTHIPNMAVYMAYCVNQATAIKVLQSLRDSNSELVAHLARLRENPAIRNLDLSSYLLVPMQRITRYPLLIKQILNHTENESEREDVQQALEISEKILDNINETIRDQEGRERLRNISRFLWIGQGRLDLTAPTRYMGQRKLVKEGQLIKAKSGRKLYAFLCSDILVLTDESMKNLYRMPIPLSQAGVSGGKDDLVFEVSQAYPRGGEAITLKATSPRESLTWVREIEKAGRRCRRAEERARRKL